MTDDLTARIEELAKQCAEHIEPYGVHHWVEYCVPHLSRFLTTLATSIISEKNAEAAALRERLELGGKIAARIGVAHGKDVIERLSDWWYEGTLQLLYKDGIPIHTAGRDLLAELASLRERVRELEKQVINYVNGTTPIVR